MQKMRQLIRYQKIVGIVLALLLIVGAMPAAAASAADAGQKSQEPNIEEVKFWLDLLYVRPIDWEKIDDSSVESIFESLGDKYSSYLTPTAFEDLSTRLGGSYGGVGIYIQQVEGYVTVTAPIEGSPADRAGLQPGDRIIKVDGVDVVDTPLEQVVSMIKGEPGTEVELTVLRGDKELLFNLTRDEVRVHSVTGKMLEDGIGYIRIHSFGENAVDELKAELARLDEAGALGYIIDLRNNGGGYLTSALELADVLVDKGPIVHVVRRSQIVRTYTTSTEGIDKPLVVLVNKGSASAAEILAAAIRETGHGILVGTETFGKASVQRIVGLSNGGKLKVTTAHYLTPNKTNINEVGLKPTFYVEGMEQQLAKAREVLKVAIEQEKRKPAVPTVQLFIGKDTGFVRGNEVALEVEPFIARGRAYVPLRFICENLGLQVQWQEAGNTIEIFGAGKKIFLSPGSSRVHLNGKARELAAPVMVRAGHSFVPVRFFIQLLDGEVKWIAKSRQVNIFYSQH